MVKHSLETLPLLVILLVLHALHRTLLSIEDLESHLISELLRKDMQVLQWVYAYIYISNDQVLAIALLLKGCQLPSDY